MLLCGLPGSGTSTALASLCLGIVEAHHPDRLHIHILDFDDQGLAPLKSIPHVGSVIAGSDRERQTRLLRRLSTELDARRDGALTGPVDGPTIIAMVDNYGAFADAFSEPGDLSVHSLLGRLIADGPGVGIFVFLTAKQPGDVPSRIASLFAARLAFRLADRYEYTAMGVPAVEPPDVIGRAFEAGSGREIQVAALHARGLAAAVDALPASTPSNPPWTIDVLPSRVSVAEFLAIGHLGTDEWFLPFGIGDSGLVPTGLVLREGENALITGPARSGKTTALITLAQVARTARPELRIHAITPRRSALGSADVIDGILETDAVIDLAGSSDPWLLLVDDAELVEPGAAISDLLRRRNPAGRVVAAGMADALRSLYGHWTQDLRRSRIGCALRPNVASDGDLWQTQLPRNHPGNFPAGRGYLLADGQAELVQVGCE